MIKRQNFPSNYQQKRKPNNDSNVDNSDRAQEPPSQSNHHRRFLTVEKPIILIIVLILIGASIFYLETKKAAPQQNILNGKQEGMAIDETSGTRQVTPEEAEKAKKYVKAPEFAGIEHWINSEPLSITDLRGKVVLIDFWTYTCINCIRTLPYITMWDEKYKDSGLVIIGVHTPEFVFEKNTDNVVQAMADHNIHYIVAQDNDYETWRAYQNRYWPRKYLVDIDGFIRYDHIGEGNYEETEKMIQELLEERKERLNEKFSLNFNITQPDDVVEMGDVGTPEIYFGYGFARGNFGNKEGIVPEKTLTYTLPEKFSFNDAYLAGTWKNNQDDMELVSDEGIIVLPYQAKAVNIVAGAEPGSKVEVYLDDEKINVDYKGEDLEGDKAQINEFKLYNLVMGKASEKHIIKIMVKGKGFRLYTFTFG